MWVKNVLLRLDAGTVKKEEPIHAEWILQMPREWQVAFVQGLADGDGSASVKSFYVRIATVPN
jgi:intein/homing endonuclease